MKLARIILSLLLGVNAHIALPQAQEKPECIEYTQPGASEIKRYTGNNKYLLEVLKNHDLVLPDDYFDRLDRRGLYQGKRIEVEDVKVNHDVESDDSEGRMMSGSTIYYLPVKVWVYVGGSGAAASITDVNNLMQETTALYRSNGVPIELYVKCNIEFVNNHVLRFD